MNTTSSNSAQLYYYYSKKWLSTLEPRLVTYQFGERTSLPEGMGKQVKWLRYGRIAGDTAKVLSEGVIPAEGTFSVNNITADIVQYGDFIKVSDLLQQTAIDPVLSHLMERLGAAAADLIEKLNIAELDANAGIFRINKAANDNALTAADVPTLREFIRAMIQLKRTFVPKHRKINAYGVVLHPSHEYDLQAETNVGGLLDVSKYELADRSALLNGEVGKAYGMRFSVSDDMTSAANGSSVVIAKSYVIGDEPFGVVELGGKNFELIMKDRKSGGVANPLEQFSTVGYKLPGYVCKYFGAVPSGTLDRMLQVRGASAS